MIEFKFRVVRGERIVGYEALIDGYWCRSDNGKDWQFGTLNSSGHKRYQYTGLKDKNGVEIYEGDIIASDKTSDGFQHISTLEHGWCEHDGNEYGWHFRNGGPVRPVDDIDGRYEVIGNIYQNKDLLNIEANVL